MQFTDRNGLHAHYMCLVYFDRLMYRLQKRVDSSLFMDEIHHAYVEYCSLRGIPPATTSVIGKYIAVLYPESKIFVTSRRAGYTSLAMQADSIQADPMQADSTQADLESCDQGISLPSYCVTDTSFTGGLRFTAPLP